MEQSYTRSVSTQATDYYPFGRSFENVNVAKNRYLYNGKELQDQLVGGTPFGWYDYGARFYDPEVPHFTSMDPLTEKISWQSPYCYAANNPMRNIDFEGLYPKSIIRSDEQGLMHFTKSAAYLLSLVSGVSTFYTENVIIQERGPGHYLPWYSMRKDGGGGITLGSNGYQSTITYTSNFFEDDPTAYNNHGYGQDIEAWLKISAHEVVHIPQIDREGGGFSYLAEMIKQYAQYGHENAPNEVEAEKGRDTFRMFNAFVNKNYGSNSLSKLFNSDAREYRKIGTIQKWWNAYQEDQNQQRKQATQSFLNNYQNLQEGKYTWNGTTWVKQN